MMRVLMAIDSYRVSGPAKGLLDFCESARGHVQPLVLAFQRGRREVTEFRREADRRRIPMQVVWERWRYDVSALGRARRVAESFRPDVIQTHGYKANLVGVVLKWRLGVPWLAFSHGRTDEGPKTRLYHRLGDFVLRRADRIVAVSAARKAALIAQGVAPGKIAVVHNAVTLPSGCVDVAAVRRELGLRGDRPLIAVIGRLSPEKGQAHCVGAMADVVRALPGVQALLLGEGQDEGCLRAQAASLGLGEAVRFAGYRPDLDRLYPAIDLLVLPSLSEGLPNVVLEAMAHARAVVATRVGGVPEVVDDGVSGVLVPAADAPALAHAIVEMLQDAPRRAAMGEIARARIVRDFSVHARTERLLALYAGLLRRRPDATDQTNGPGLGTRPVAVR